MNNINSGAEPTQRDYQGKIMGTLMKFFRVRDVEEFSILMRPDNESSVLLNAVMQKERPVINVDIFDDEKEVEIEDHNASVTAVVLPGGTLRIEYGESERDNKNSTVYVWKDDGGEVNYGFRTGE
jgi:rhodanese-related sulfurtransferase